MKGEDQEDMPGTGVGPEEIFSAPKSHEKKVPAPNQNAGAAVVLFNAVVAGTGGIYISTQSVLITALAAVLGALLALIVGRKP
ncbi:hypothetical protein J8N05_46955 (plasmid) [Streptomyces sp. BH-SS-21]|uniref:Uncharacterized protein n=1 Tax=Streptomyces liliiviolaceus TaxID=2823109 RepID=A0A941BC62_9ACTN|nr:hypothetical protein [Streptomyces liliiviolaceus]MBQ0855701.1 hypothetical protein [Streptomyces liliiviolaceus]